MPLSFAKDIRPLFRDDPDVETMIAMGLDLSSYAGVKASSQAILSRLKDGSMPCDGPWLPERVALFEQWISEGMAP